MFVPTKIPKSQNKSKTKLATKDNLNNTNLIKNKKITHPTTDVSPYFYAVSNSNPNTKLKLDQDSVKQYLKFVKNITITYPVMIPSRDNIKNYNSIKKSQKMKEKSRDINSNRNVKLIVPKSTEMPTSAKTTTLQKGQLGN